MRNRRSNLSSSSPTPNKSNSSQNVKDKKEVSWKPIKRRRLTLDHDDSDSDSTKCKKRTINKKYTNDKILRSSMKKVIKNDNVLAFVKSREEELLRIEKETGSQTKITRSKAKAHNHDPLPTNNSISLPTKLPISEVSALIQEELHSDEEDEDDEYQPGDDIPDADAASSDDNNTTNNDFDDPLTPMTPRTPGTPYKNYDNDLDFLSKSLNTPSQRRDSESQTEEQEIIARRTRSKLSLTTTSIETIQSTFIPPDIPTDMCNFEGDTDIDNVWKDFLNDFTLPLSIDTYNDDDDEADPEYVAVDNNQFDVEEHKPLNISKKELNELIGELCDMAGMIDDFGNIIENAPASTSLNKSKHNNRIKKPRDKQPEQQQQQQQQQQQLQEKSDLSCSIFLPDGMSTPHHSIEYNNDKENLNNNELRNSQSKDCYYDVSKLNILYRIKDANQSNLPIIIQDDNNIIIEVIDLASPSTTTTEPSIDYNQNLTDDVKKYCTNKFLQIKERYAYLENCNGKEEKYQFKKNQKGLTVLQLSMLKQQLRMHVQLATQGYLQTYKHPLEDMKNFSIEYKKFLTSLYDCGKKSTVPHSLFLIWNLKLSLEFCNELDKEANQISYSIQSLDKWYMKEVKSQLNAAQKRSTFITRFPRYFLRKIVHSQVFLYPTLLPKRLFQVINHDRSRLPFAISEDIVIVYYLDRYYNELKKSKGKITFTDACRYVKDNLCVLKTYKSVHHYIFNRKHQNSPMNPIKYYFNYNKIPPINFELIPFTQQSIRAPKDVEVEQLPPVYANYVKNFVEVCNTSLISDQNSKKTDLIIFNLEKPSSSNYVALSSVDSNFTARSLGLPDIDCEQRSSSSGSLSTFTSLQTNVSLCKCVDYTDCSEEFDSLDEFNFPKLTYLKIDKNDKSTEAFITKYREKPNRGSIQIRQGNYQKILPITAKFPKIIEDFQTNYNKFNLTNSISQNKNKLEIFNWFKTFDIYTSLLIQLKMNISNMNIKKAKIGETNLETDTKKIVKGPEQNDSQVQESAATSSKRFQKIQKANDIGRLILMKERVADIEKKDSTYAQNFYAKVEEILTSSDNPDDFIKFKSILANFNLKSSTVPELYYELEKLFLPDHKDLAEVLLTFLLPEHAAQIGKFFEHFMLTNMSSFINKLNIYFSKQPAQIRKIYACLNELTAEDDLTMDSIKTRILPLIKCNQILTDWFLQLFPNEKPSESTEIEYERISYRPLEEDNNTDVYENIPPSEIFSDPENSSNPSCGIKYLQGRIFYGNGILLPAKLSFLATDACLEEKTVPPETNAPVLNKPNFCVHEIKEFGDKKIHEINKIHSDTEMNSSHSSEDIDVPEDNLLTIGPKVKKKKFEKSNVSNPSYKLCDASALMAHGIRLNPSYHACRGDMPSLDSLASSTSTDKLHDDNNSPKKQTNKTQAGAKVPKKQPSPSTKKLNKSPNSGNQKKIDENLTVSTDSPIIVTAKQLKTIIETDQSSDDDNKQSNVIITTTAASGISVTSKASTSSTNTAATTTILPTTKTTLPTTRTTNVSTIRKEESSESDCGRKKIPKKRKIKRKKIKKASSPVNNNKEKLIVDWSRDEDKIILETIEGGYETEDELFSELLRRLNDREKTDIIERYKFLMDIWEKFQNTDNN